MAAIAPAMPAENFASLGPLSKLESETGRFQTNQTVAKWVGIEQGAKNSGKPQPGGVRPFAPSTWLHLVFIRPSFVRLLFCTAR